MPFRSFSLLSLWERRAGVVRASKGTTVRSEKKVEGRITQGPVASAVASGVAAPRPRGGP
jgi:hypothetical protein